MSNIIKETMDIILVIVGGIAIVFGVIMLFIENNNIPKPPIKQRQNKEYEK